jgi:hypothetical protein
MCISSVKNRFKNISHDCVCEPGLTNLKMSYLALLRFYMNIWVAMRLYEYSVRKGIPS